MEIPITAEAINDWKKSDQNIDKFFPDLTADQREFIISGITTEEWDQAFGDELSEDFGSHVFEADLLW